MSRRVLVTGSSRGIGSAIAERLAAAGYDIAVHCRSSAVAGAEVVERIRARGRSAVLLQFDVADGAAAAAAIKADMAEYGIYYAVVCSAGITRDAPFAGMQADDWSAVLRTNLDGFYNVLNPIVLPMIVEKIPGRIVVLSSVSGLIGQRGQVNYSAAKAGLIGAVKALAREIGKKKITVNCVAPGLIETDLTEGLPLAEMLKQIPLGRLGKPEEVAALTAFLLSEEAAYITGQVISINGGMI